MSAEPRVNAFAIGSSRGLLGLGLLGLGIGLLLGCGGAPARVSEQAARGEGAVSSEPPRAEPPGEEPYVCAVEHRRGRRGEDETVLLEHRYRFDGHGRLLAEQRIVHEMGGYTMELVYEYDERGRLVRVRTAGAPDDAAEVITYSDGDDPAHQVVQHRGGGEGAPSDIVWTFDDRGRVLRADVTERPPGPPGAPAFERSYSIQCEWAPSGQLASIQHEGERSTYAYSDSRLTTVTTTFEGSPEVIEDEVVHAADRMDVWRADGSAPGHVRYVGRCEDVFFRLCSPAFVPPPPGSP